MRVMKEITPEQRKAIDDECERLKKLIPPKSVTRQGRANMSALTGQFNENICKSCGNPTNSGYKYCTKCFYMIKRANEKRRKYY